MTYDVALTLFGESLGQLKRSYAEKFNVDERYLQVIIDKDNFVTIYPTNECNDYVNCSRQWTDTNIE